jgi:nitrogen fixation NifU-like protein
MNIYQEIILDNYHHPQNSGKPAEFTHSAKIENPTCGDEIEVFLKVADGAVQQMQYLAHGCAISVASASLLSQEIVGKPLAEVKLLSEDFILKLLGIELTPTRINCAMLAINAVKAAA